MYLQIRPLPRYLTRFGCSGGKEDLLEPRGIAIYRRFGQVFVTEKAGARYFWVGTDVENLTSTARKQDGRVTVDVRFLLTEQSHVTIRVETDRGETLATAVENRFMEPGNIRRTFVFGAETLPGTVAECKYELSVSARATYSSKSYHSVRKTVRLRFH